MKRCYAMLLLAAWAGALLTGCDDKSESEPGPPPEPPAPVQLTVPEVSISEAGPDSFRASWKAVTEAAGYACELFTEVDGTPTRVQEKNPNSATEVLFEGLTAETSYEVRVKALAPEGGGYIDSEYGRAQTRTTAPQPTAPWVEIGLECISLNGKLAVQAKNTPNELCAHYYLSTANVNVIGGGIDTEAQVIEFLLLDYEDGVPGIYRDKEVLTCNNNGAGLDAGQKLFYYVVGEDASGRTGALNWVWFQVPENAGDEVIVLDGPDK